jgi:hypothetical protein
LEVTVGDVGGLANVGEASVGGSTTLSVSGVGVVVAVAGVVGVARGTAPCELWRLDMRGLAVPPAGVLHQVS